MRVCFDHGVEDDEELAHTGGDDDLERLSSGFKALREDTDHGVVSLCGEGCHIEGTADMRASTPNGTLTLEFPAVAIEGGQAGESTDLLAIELSEFRKIGEERYGRGRPDTGRTAEDLDLTTPVVIRFQEGEDTFLDPPNIFIQSIDHVLNAFANVARGTGLKTIGFRCAQIDELTTAGDELFKFGLFFGSFRNGAGTNVLAEPGDDGGIDAVGLGQDSQPPCEITDLTRIDDGHAMTGVKEIGNEALLIPAGSFNHDKTGSGGRELAAKLQKAVLVVGERERGSLRQQTHVKGMFTDVNTNERGQRTVHGMLPVLQMRARRRWSPATALAAVRAVSTKPATITLCVGLGRPGHDRSVAGRRGAGCSATRCLRVSSLRSLPHGSVNLTI